MNSSIEDHISKFCADYRILTYRKGDIVVRGDDEPTGVYFIKSGMVKMSLINEEGDELSVNIFKPGTFFPMTWAIGDISNSYNYQALSEAKLVRVPKEDFLAFLQKNPPVLYDLTRRIIIGLDGLVFNMRLLLSSKSETRVAVILFMLAKRFGVQKGNQVEIDLKITHNDISRFAGLTRETTTISLNKLTKEGVIVQRQRKIIVKSMDDLRAKFNKSASL